MREIIRITIGLTVSCMAAALVMGTVFVITDKAKKNNERLNHQKTMLSLLGYDTTHAKPDDLKFHTVYRYILDRNGGKSLGYLVPVNHADQEHHQLLIVNLKGEFQQSFDLPISPENAADADERRLSLNAVLDPPTTFETQDSFIIADKDHQRLAYLLPGEFPGFKTFISVMLAVDPSFRIIGLEIVQHEEDPGLGGEIEQAYFKNQFRGKSFEQIQKMNVISEPLPPELRQYLETQNPGPIFDANETQHDHIYSLTGATISSKSVTHGVRNIVEKFAYRMRFIEHVISDQKVPTTFAGKEDDFGTHQ